MNHDDHDDDHRDPIERMFDYHAGPTPDAQDTTLDQDKELALALMAAYSAARDAHAAFAKAQEIAAAQGRSRKLLDALHQGMTYCDEADQTHFDALHHMGITGEEDLAALVEGEGFNPQ